jgi:hypothetical protein
VEREVQYLNPASQWQTLLARGWNFVSFQALEMPSRCCTHGYNKSSPSLTHFADVWKILGLDKPTPTMTMIVYVSGQLGGLQGQYPL